MRKSTSDVAVLKNKGKVMQCFSFFGFFLLDIFGAKAFYIDVVVLILILLYYYIVLHC